MGQQLGMFCSTSYFVEGHFVWKYTHVHIACFRMYTLTVTVQGKLSAVNDRCTLNESTVLGFPKG